MPIARENLDARSGRNRARIWKRRAAAVIRMTYRCRSAAYKRWPLRNKCWHAGIRADVGCNEQRRSLTVTIRVETGSVLQLPDRRLEQAKASTRRFFHFPIA